MERSHEYSGERFSFYFTYRISGTVKKYLKINLEYFFLKVVAKFRAGMSCIAVHYF